MNMETLVPWPTALMVDEDEATAEMYGFALAAAGYSVSTVNCPEAALLALSREVPDVLLLDIDLPRMSGVSLLREIRCGRASRGLPQLMTLFLTNSDDAALRRAGLDLGALDCLIKWETPPAQLVRRVAEVTREPDTSSTVTVVRTGVTTWSVTARPRRDQAPLRISQAASARPAAAGVAT
jgi:DNA-binding response OmpR family regulator